MRIYFWALLMLPIVVFGLIVAIVYKPSRSFLDTDFFVVSEFSDKNDGGNSESAIKINPAAVNVHCVLKDGYEFPYSGIQFNKKGLTLFDLNNYTLSLKLNVSYDVRLSIRLNQYIDNYTDSLSAMSYLILTKSFGLSKGENMLDLKISDVNEIQDWWFQFNPLMINRISNISYDKTRILWLYIENSTPLNQPLRIDIEQFDVHYSLLPLLYNFSVGAIVYYFILLLAIWKVKKVKYILMPIELSAIGNTIPETQNRILTYIGNNFVNSELKLQDVAHEIGISQDDVSELLKQHCKLSFRQYLNQVRLEEAKHLIRNTNLQIAEIAYKVGYNNIQHFNRVFKDYTSFTPTVFRDFK